MNARVEYIVASPDEYDYWAGFRFTIVGSDTWVEVVFRCASSGRSNAIAMRNYDNPNWKIVIEEE